MIDVFHSWDSPDYNVKYLGILFSWCYVADEIWFQDFKLFKLPLDPLKIIYGFILLRLFFFCSDTPTKTSWG